ncbi:P-loop containing nucleoside triphosphate hydrolase [Glarea lozoyensis ATCC 20868]|uniref:p-loop containing nucleoside triphosphate hydrolase n=1 Tax=Glarea lozoyensis (strain ATCC 20868 / MF5171) TaxID=1116229 RepID=S3DCU7_GLAL2|nr:P-loop containing nucleoside triphosphate hydrolase [Glarea lozoyensis ATCC 20868]EPE35560.1 P-loop containing nucleoside triphosphate hydrolase [Glarea lozoyensis ATCC 20868]
MPTATSRSIANPIVTSPRKTANDTTIPQFLPRYIHGWSLAPSKSTTTAKTTAVDYSRKFWVYNFLHGIEKDEVDVLAESSTTRQRRVIRNKLDRIPGGVLRISGASGTGKTTLLISLMMLALGQSCRILAFSDTQIAAEALAAHFEKRNEHGDILAIRFCGQAEEASELYRSLDGAESLKTAEESKWRPKITPSYSLAAAVWLVLGEAEPQNDKLFRLWKTYQNSARLIRDLSHLQSLKKRTEVVRRVAKDIVNRAEIIFTSIGASRDSFLYEYSTSAGHIFLQNASEVDSIHDFIDYTSKPIVFASCNSIIEEDSRFAKLQDGLEWTLTQQIQADPGLFDVANSLFHSITLVYPRDARLSSLAGAFNTCASSYADLRGTTLTPPPAGKAYPLLLDLRNCNTYYGRDQSEKRTREFVKFGLQFLLYLLKQNDSITAKDIIVLSHTAGQCNDWQIALEDERNSELTGIGVSTIKAMRGWDSKFVLWDTAVGAGINHHHDFMPDRKEIYTAITSHSKGLVIVADTSPSKCGKRQVVETGSRAKILYCEECKSRADSEGSDHQKTFPKEDPTIRAAFDWMEGHGCTIQIDSNNN